MGNPSERPVLPAQHSLQWSEEEVGSGQAIALDLVIMLGESFFARFI